jgi:phosphatidylglycerol:prolipoprotein diacylglycerol transferase
VAEPLIPYITLPEIPLSFLKHVPLLGDMIDPRQPPSIKPFGTLVALGVYFGAVLAMRRAKQRGHDPKAYSDFVFWTVGSGFVISHVLDAIFYHPDTVKRDPLYLLKIWDGLSSYGGLIGAVVGSLAYGFYHRRKVLELMDITVSAFPVAWVFGRAGCSVVHDHPGILSNAWFAVRYPAHGGTFVGRLDLGLLEFAFTVPFATACYLLWQKNPRRPTGYWIALTCIIYAPVRFLLDFLRVGPKEVALGADERYLTLTPAQWAAFLMLGTGLYFLWRIRARPTLAMAASLLEPPAGGADGSAVLSSEEPKPKPGSDQPPPA